MATLILEKILDGLALVFVVLLAILFLSSPRWFGSLAFFSGGVFAFALFLTMLLKFRSQWFLASTEKAFAILRLPCLGRKTSALLAKFVEGLMVVSSPGQMARLAFLTVVIWLGDTVGVWGLAQSMNIPLGFPEAVVISAVIGLGLTIPAGPGSLGTYEAFAVAGLALFGVEADRAVPFALAGHAWTFLQTNGLGLLCVLLAGRSLPQILKLGNSGQVVQMDGSGPVHDV